ncbi:MAG TPA: reverse transcriptase domain-containing protein [Polyangiaceae bacterium]|nr:reverse transcriptase domain-containing protein [Polyangiaceae bacterium]
MGLWDTIKSWFGVSSPIPDTSPAPPSAAAGSPSQLSASGPRPEPGPGAARAEAPRSTPKTNSPDRFEAPGILGLSAAQLRIRALKINPFATPWIGRVDTIPPQTDERTALIDRGLVLRGLLSVAQLREIHRVGDLWLKFRDARNLAVSYGRQRAEEVIQQRRAEHAQKKQLKRQEAAARRQAEQQARAARKANDIIFAGRGVSHRLGNRRSQIEDLTRAGLPLLATPADLAQALGITVPALRWLCFHHESPERTHYVYFEIPKRSGGTRLIASPKSQLRRTQRWIFDTILSRLPVTEAAHGFVKGRSTVSNAAPHQGQHVLVNLDLADFFPSVTFPRVRGLFESLGYSPAVATLLALLCTESARTLVEFEGRKHWVAVHDRALPQGACTSPTIANLVARKLDRRLGGASRKLGFEYTRYADDLTFSAESSAANVGLLLARVRHIVKEEGFALNPKKGRVQRRSRRQEVTGVVVNDKLSVARDELRELRAILHNARRTGLQAQNREQRPHFEAWLRGRIGYVMMIDPIKGRALAAQLNACSP